MRCLRCIVIIVVLNSLTILNTQNPVNSGLFSQIPGAGLGKVAIGSIDNDGFTGIVDSARSGEVIAGTSDVKKEPARSDRKYYLSFNVQANGYPRRDKPVELQLNFSALLANTGENAKFSPNSLQLIEVDHSGQVINAQLSFQFDKADEFDAGKKALGTLVFIMPGITAPDQTRFFRLYFDDIDHPQHPVRSLVSVEDIGLYEGYATYKIITRNSDYYFHISSGGFASIKDKEGRDWVSYHPNKEPESGFKGRFRGIPNIAPPEFHPGSPDPIKSSRIISEGPVKVSIVTETEDKQWSEKWDFYPDYATMTLMKKGTEPYWILYEGTPGGEFNEDDYWVRSDGTREIMKPYHYSRSQWTGHLPTPKWVYFGDRESDRVLYYIHHEDYIYEDVLWHSGEGGMTVFGFGRGPTQENWQQLTNVPAHLTLGFAEKNDFPYVSKLINNAYKSLKIHVGEIVKPENK